MVSLASEGEKVVPITWEACLKRTQLTEWQTEFKIKFLSWLIKDGLLGEKSWQFQALAFMPLMAMQVVHEKTETML